MSEQWFYRIYGQEFGPVSLDLVRTLVAAGTIAPDDEVREATRSNWILACAAYELRDSIKSPQSDRDVERRTVRDEWFCRGADGDFGPLKLVDLIQLAVDGELSPDEQVKAKADDYWKQVSSIRRLVELLPFPDEQRRPVSTANRPTLIERNQWFKTADDNTSDSAIGMPDQVSQPDSDFVGGRQTTVRSQPQGIGTPDPDDPSDNEEADVILFPTDRSTRSVDAKSLIDQLNSTDSLTNILGEFGTLSSLNQVFPATLRSEQHCESDLAGSEWTGWIGGEEFGPISYTQLLTWAVTGRLSPVDFVRQGQEGPFVPAVSIPRLFTVRAATDSLFRRTVSMASIEAPIMAKSQSALQSVRDAGCLKPGNRQRPHPSGQPPLDWSRFSVRAVTRFIKDSATNRRFVALSAVIVLGITILIRVIGP